MNVLVVTNMYPTKKYPFYGIFVKEQVESLRNEGVIIDVYFINGKENRLNYFKSVNDIASKIKRKHYDIIHLHHSYCVFPVKIAEIITKLRIPLILTFHEGEVHYVDGSQFKNVDLFKRLVLSKKLKKAALKMSDAVITVDEKILKKLNFNGRYTILPCGVDLELFRPMDQKICRKKINLPLNKKILFFPASPADRQKGFNILKESLQYMKKNNVLLVKGGNINHDMMPYYMNAADVVVQLSLFEASPSVLKEALAVNKVLVFTDAGDAKIIIKNAEGSFLCERNPKSVASKINHALNYVGKSTGRERIINANLSLEKVSKSILKIYCQLLNQE